MSFSVLKTTMLGILTFGGAYSNHLLATAAASAEVGLKSIGIVRVMSSPLKVMQY
jgi:1-aminocyclopropane-1-carboxylate deaminase/D-cysteine desulfhydrase-like pyridoxal-dependent ACC family enzyme